MCVNTNSIQAAFVCCNILTFCDFLLVHDDPADSFCQEAGPKGKTDVLFFAYKALIKKLINVNNMYYHTN